MRTLPLACEGFQQPANGTDPRHKIEVWREALEAMFPIADHDLRRMSSRTPMKQVYLETKGVKRDSICLAGVAV
jgi:hypothetical protein